MKESYSEIVAEYAGPESYADNGNTVVWQRQGYTQAQRLSSDIKQSRVPTLLSWWKATPDRSLKARSVSDAAESKAWSMCGNSKHENREIPWTCWRKSPAAVRKLPWR